jgi:hypothetical protein
VYDLDKPDEMGVLELVNAVHALGLLLGINETAECSLEIFSTWAVGHATQARAVPVDLTGLRVERGLLSGLLLKFLRVHATFQRLGGRPLFPDLGGNGVESFGGCWGIFFLQMSEDRD